MRRTLTGWLCDSSWEGPSGSAGWQDWEWYWSRVRALLFFVFFSLYKYITFPQITKIISSQPPSQPSYQDLLNTSCIPSSVLGTEDTAENKTERSLPAQGWYSGRGDTQENKETNKHTVGTPRLWVTAGLRPQRPSGQVL